jgi:hypothetical protein
MIKSNTLDLIRASEIRKKNLKAAQKLMAIKDHKTYCFASAA